VRTTVTNQNYIHEEVKSTFNFQPLGRTRRRWEDNIKMDLKEIVWENVDWIHLAENKEHRN
jgi:hypothetical protein